jgi:hypothetical protein
VKIFAIFVPYFAALACFSTTSRPAFRRFLLGLAVSAPEPDTMSLVVIGFLALLGFAAKRTEVL